ncbi:hypothetical protein [Amphibacillus jilinensis]|uniref:hypothetical protein n=1 Tax=Amphibacillus jilinensis TaxID=1216008 RepID=UPI0002D944B0|nr:hypothetical protein [Amphibacillus jilinensis]
MSNDLLSAVIEVIFGGYMLYVAPFLFLMMIVLFSDRLIDLIYSALEQKKDRY